MEATAPSEAATSEIEVQRALSTTATIFTEVDALVKRQQQQADGSATATATEVAVSLKQLKSWRALARRANAAIARNAKASHAALDRLSVEIALLKSAIKNECIDKEAHLARVLTKLREGDAMESANDAAVPPLASGGGGGRSDQNARRVDRAHSAALRVEHAIETLAALPERNLHGVPTIAYLASRDAPTAPTAVAAAGAAATAS
jgi:hypothetical protein